MKPAGSRWLSMDCVSITHILLLAISIGQLGVTTASDGTEVDNSQRSDNSAIHCSRTYFGRDAGVIASYNYPFNYSSDLNCRYRIDLAHITTYDKRVCLVFNRFSLEHADESGQAYDYILLKGMSSYTNGGGQDVGYCGTGDACIGTPPGGKHNVWQDDFCWEAGGSYFDIVFFTDGSVQREGFYATYTVITSYLRLNEIPSIPDTRDAPYYINTAPCGEHQWTCFSRQCIAVSDTCDGQVDCEFDDEQSDETYAHARCMPSTNGLYPPSLLGCDFFEFYGCGFYGLLLGQGWMLSGGSEDPQRGPQHDHTGYHAFARSEFATSGMSSADLVDYHTAVAPNQAYCLSFWYHMHGHDAGALHVYLLSMRQSLRPLWSRDGNYGNRWRHGEVLIAAGDLHEADHVAFVGRRGSDKNTQISVDDITLTQGNCTGEDVSCNWEIGLCGWTVDGWLRMRSGDHSSENQDGFYLGTDYGETDARAQSPVVTYGEGDVCLVLWTECSPATDGELHGQLTVLLRFNDGSVYPIYTITCSSSWQEDQISIYENRAYQIEIVGSYTSNTHIKLDQLSLMEGPCYGISTGSCASGEFRCADGECISVSLMCNGFAYCSDGSDEWYSTCSGCPLGVCSEDEFCCRDGTCLEQSQVCDGHNGCGDWHDEDDCAGKCSGYECPSGRCVSTQYVCDGQSDCPDGSDEHDCGSSDDTWSLSLAAIVGIVAGGVVLFCVIVTRCALYYYKHDRRCMCAVAYSRCTCCHRDDSSVCSGDTTPSDLDPSVFQPPPDYEEAVRSGLPAGQNQATTGSVGDDKQLPAYQDVLAGGFTVVPSVMCDVPPPRYNNIYGQNDGASHRDSRPPRYSQNPDYMGNTDAGHAASYDNHAYFSSTEYLTASGQLEQATVGVYNEASPVQVTEAINDEIPDITHENEAVVNTHTNRGAARSDSATIRGVPTEPVASQHMLAGNMQSSTEMNTQQSTADDVILTETSPEAHYRVPEIMLDPANLQQGSNTSQNAMHVRRRMSSASDSCSPAWPSQSEA